MKVLIIVALVSGFALTASAEEDKKTARTWKAKCASCHGADGNGDTDQGKKSGAESMTAAAWQKARTDAQMKEAIEKGIKREKNGKKQEMDAFASDLKPEQIDALIKLVRSFEKK